MESQNQILFRFKQIILCLHFETYIFISMHCIVLYCMKMSTYYNEIFCLQKKERKKNNKNIEKQKQFFCCFFSLYIRHVKGVSYRSKRACLCMCATVCGCCISFRLKSLFFCFGLHFYFQFLIPIERCSSTYTVNASL